MLMIGSIIVTHIFLLSLYDLLPRFFYKILTFVLFNKVFL